MAEGFWNLEKQAHLLDGRERARFIIKDTYQKTYGDKKGFLNESERQALMRISDSQVKQEYETLWEAYEQMPLTMAVVREAYLQFKYSFEALKKAHVFLNLSPAVSYLSKLIEQNITNENANKDALKVVGLIQVLETDPLGDTAFKKSLSFVKGIVTKASEQARHFISLKKTVDQINESMGFNIFMIEHYSESCQVFADEINLCIKEHNQIMNSIGAGIPDLGSYLIPDSKDS